jgi:acetyltransferase-like isoleucine patch superfamily enzyme
VLASTQRARFRLQVQGNGHLFSLSHKAGAILGGVLFRGHGCAVLFGARVHSNGSKCLVSEPSGSIIVSDDCLFARNVVIRASDSHAIIDLATRTRTNEPRSIIIGRHVWIGADAKITKGVTIGRGSIVAANAYVNRSTPDCSLVVGIPGRVVRENVSWTMSELPTKQQIDDVVAMLSRPDTPDDQAE